MSILELEILNTGIPGCRAENHSIGPLCFKNENTHAMLLGITTTLLIICSSNRIVWLSLAMIPFFKKEEEKAMMFIVIIQESFGLGLEDIVTSAVRRLRQEGHDRDTNTKTMTRMHSTHV